MGPNKLYLFIDLLADYGLHKCFDLLIDWMKKKILWKNSLVSWNLNECKQTYWELWGWKSEKIYKFKSLF